MKKIWGNILFYLAKFIDVVLGGLIEILKLVVELVENIRQLLIGIITTGCLFFAISPYLTLLLLPNLGIISVILVIMILPLLGRSFANFLEYGKYVLCEYLYDKADYYRLGKVQNHKTMGDYSNTYRKNKREEEFKQREEEQRREQEYWEQRFEDFFNQSQYGGQGRYTNQGYGGSQGRSQYRDPTSEFNNKYRKSCEILGVDLGTDEYEVKLQYRKLAKKYHPDLNPNDPNANEKFTEINEAYEFLSKENIDRYKKLNNL